MEGHLGDIIDGADLVRLAERELMAPLDSRRAALVTAAATRVSAFTALSPRAAVDMLFVLGTALVVVRRLSLLYGARPGTLGLMRLMRHVVVHLVMTGGMAASDSLIQQMLGHGIAAKLSARLGEGMLNGLLTARLGPRRHRGHAAAAVHRPAASDGEQSDERRAARLWRQGRSAAIERHRSVGILEHDPEKACPRT